MVSNPPNPPAKPADNPGDETSSPADSTTSRWFRGFLLLRGALYAVSLIPVSAFLATYFAPNVWVLDLLNNFQVQLLIAQLPCLILAVLLRRWRLTACLSVPLLLCLWGVTGVYRAAPVPARDSAQLKIMSVNVYHLNDDYAEMIDIVQAYDPDILVLVELTPRWFDQMTPLRETYPHQSLEPRYWGAGIGLFSKLPLEVEGVHQLSPEIRDCPVVRCRVRLAEEPLDIYAVHTLSPRSEQHWRIRDHQLEKLSRFIQQSPSEKVVLGDFNATTWTPSLRKFVESTQLRDSRNGFGLLPSWPSDMRWAQITIDHAFVTQGVAVTERSVLPCQGSDHLPISLTVGWRE